MSLLLMGKIPQQLSKWCTSMCFLWRHLCASFRDFSQTSLMKPNECGDLLAQNAVRDCTGVGTREQKCLLQVCVNQKTWTKLTFFLRLQTKSWVCHLHNVFMLVEVIWKCVSQGGLCWGHQLRDQWSSQQGSLRSVHWITLAVEAVNKPFKFFYGWQFKNNHIFWLNNRHVHMTVWKLVSVSFLFFLLCFYLARVHSIDH